MTRCGFAPTNVRIIPLLRLSPRRLETRVMSVASASACLRPLTLFVRIMGYRFGTDALSVMTLVVALVGLESEWVPRLARVSAAWDLMSKIRDGFGAPDDVPKVFFWLETCSQAMPGMTLGCPSGKKAVYLYPLWRFLRKIGWVFCPQHAKNECSFRCRGWWRRRRIRS